jgi:hypothetical protein
MHVREQRPLLFLCETAGHLKGILRCKALPLLPSLLSGLQVFGAATPAQLDALEQALNKPQGKIFVQANSTALDSQGQEASDAAWQGACCWLDPVPSQLLAQPGCALAPFLSHSQCGAATADRQAELHVVLQQLTVAGYPYTTAGSGTAACQITAA